MRSRYLILFFSIALGLFACKKNSEPPPVGTPPPGPPTIRLKDIVYRNLPSPYYHFEYNDSGYITQSSFSSGIRKYEISYVSKRISEVKSVETVNKDRLVYEYVDGKVALIKYVDENAVVFRRAFLTYNGTGQLTKMEWELKQENVGFIMERVLSFTYLADGNLSALHDQRMFIDGRQPEALYIDSFDEYDNKANVDDFTWSHKSNEHLVLLPGVKFQKNNPRKNIRTGTGVHYDITYSYTYDNLNRPATRIGDAVFTNGPEQGQHFTTHATYTYY